ncbi:MAG: hypothetical protein ACMUIM_08685 [bacterium]
MAPRDDMSVLCWEDLSYCYCGPCDYTSLCFRYWCSFLSPSRCLISFTPQFEGYYEELFGCFDSKGGMVYIEAEIFCVSRDERSNHPPIILGGPTQPVIMVAGEE